MQVILTPKAENDLKFWIKSGNKNILKKITFLIQDIQNHPFTGIGKPERLKHNLSDRWSGRIDKEHRLIYRISKENNPETLNIMSLKGH